MKGLAWTATLTRMGVEVKTYFKLSSDSVAPKSKYIFSSFVLVV